jgi:hypothetical protein
MAVELEERAREVAVSKYKTIIVEFREDPMSSQRQTKSLHDNKTEQKSGLSRHYGEIGIRVVAAAARKERTASPRS